MINHFTEYDSEILHRIIEVKRSVSDFENKYPTRENIISILKSGLWASLESEVVLTNEDFRKFFVIYGGSEKLKKVHSIINNNLKDMSYELNNKEYDNKIYKDIYKAPCLIVVAEEKNIYNPKKQSLDFVMDDMWLKSVSLNLGFRPLSLFEKLGSDQEFCDILGVEKDRYIFNGCIIGYPKNDIYIGKRPHVCEVVKWL